MRRLLTRFFAYTVVCIGLYVGYTHDAMALLILGDARMAYYCDEFSYNVDDAFTIGWQLASEPYELEGDNVLADCDLTDEVFSGWLVMYENDVGVFEPYGVYQPGDVIEIPSIDVRIIAQYEMVNTVSLTWYNGDTQLTVPSNAQSCEYGGTMTLPPEPTPPAPGLIFDGWTIKVMAQPDCSLLTGLECRSTPGCFKLTGPMCYNLVESCASVTDQETCNKSGQKGRMNCACRWSNGSCVTFDCEPGGM